MKNHQHESAFVKLRSLINNGLCHEIFICFTPWCVAISTVVNRCNSVRWSYNLFRNRWTPILFVWFLMTSLLGYFLFGFKGRIWDLIVLVPDHCLSFYFTEIRNDITTVASYGQHGSDSHRFFNTAAEKWFNFHSLHCPARFVQEYFSLTLLFEMFSFILPGAVARSEACKRPRVRSPRPAHSFVETW